jgi:hypothetical protein
MLVLKHPTCPYPFTTLDSAWDDELAALDIVERCATSGRLTAEPLWPSEASAKATRPGHVNRQADKRSLRPRKGYLDFTLNPLPPRQPLPDLNSAA